MALETGTYISDLNSSNPVATDGLSQADDHIRLVKSTIKATLPNLTGAVTGTQAELNILDGATVTTAELNKLDGLTASTTELNKVDGLTASTAELNKLDGVTATTAEINHVDGVTSAIQTQINSKQPTITGAATTIDDTNLTANRALISNGSGKVAVSSVTSTELAKLDGYTGNTADLNILSGAAAAGVTGTELGYLDGVTSSIQTQINNISSVPSGVIMMWSGSNSSIPSGFVLCNGSNGTPDLRDRFVVGSGSFYNTGATGGDNSVTLSISQIPSHNHSASSSVTDPGHTHSFKGATGSSGSGTSSRDSVPETQQTGSSTTGISVSTSIGNTGGTLSHENRPPYYALAYIMKT